MFKSKLHKLIDSLSDYDWYSTERLNMRGCYTVVPEGDTILLFENDRDEIVLVVNNLPFPLGRREQSALDKVYHKIQQRGVPLQQFDD